MALVELFSKRQKRERGEFPDIYIYEDIPQKLRVQIKQIITEALEVHGHINAIGKEQVNKFIKILRREYGLDRLTNTTHVVVELHSFLGFASYEQVLDTIELILGTLEEKFTTDPHSYPYTSNVCALIDELNQRFQESGVGYQLEGGKITRVDSQFLHSEAVRPVLNFLKEEKYKSVNEEFLNSHENYRSGRYEESIAGSLKAFESMLKTICTERNWRYSNRDTAKKLITIILQNGLLPSFLQDQIHTLQKLLESGIPTVRNKLAGHGQGPQSRSVPDYFASYTLHLTATTILLLAHANNNS